MVGRPGYYVHRKFLLSTNKLCDLFSKRDIMIKAQDKYSLLCEVGTVLNGNCRTLLTLGNLSSCIVRNLS